MLTACSLSSELQTLGLLVQSLGIESCAVSGCVPCVKCTVYSAEYCTLTVHYVQPPDSSSCRQMALPLVPRQAGWGLDTETGDSLVMALVL